MDETEHALHDSNGRWHLLAELRAASNDGLLAVLERVRLVKSAPKAAALRRPPPRGGGETLGAARRLFLVSIAATETSHLLVTLH